MFSALSNPFNIILLFYVQFDIPIYVDVCIHLGFWILSVTDAFSVAKFCTPTVGAIIYENRFEVITQLRMN